MLKNSLLDTSFFSSFSDSINSGSIESQNTIMNTFITSNATYNEASSVEDVLISELSSMISQINSIKFLVSGENVTFVESFESIDFFDKKFHVDNACTLDTTNRTLTLPEKNQVMNKFVSAIIEPGSNGTPGNSMKQFQNNDLSMIFDDSATTMFEYEKFSSAFTAEPLELNLTLKLQDTISTNSAYIKLFSEKGIPNPTIEKLSVSGDGQSYTDVQFEYIQNQNDFFLRFLTQKTRYIRVLLKQQYHEEIITDFGVNFRYSINIRQIESVSTDFSISGEYVSIPLVAKNEFSTISFSAVDYKVRFDDIKYYISANNGGKWLPIKNGEVLDLYRLDTGMPMSSSLESIRVKIEMSKLVSGNFVNIEEILNSNNDIYQLKSVPFNLLPLLGGHVSFGDSKVLKLTLDIPNMIQPEEFNQECILDFQTKSTVNLMPYYDGIEDDIVIKINGTPIDHINEKTGSYNFKFTPHTNKYNSIVVFNFTSSGLNAEMMQSGNTNSLNGDVLQSRKTFTAELYYKPYVYTREDAIITGPIIKLPYPSLYSDISNINIEAIGFGDIPNQTPYGTLDVNLQDFFDSFSPTYSYPDRYKIGSWETPVSLYKIARSTGSPPIANPIKIDNLSIEDSWCIKIQLEKFAHIFSYSMTPKFDYDSNGISTQLYTPKEWTVFGKAKMYVDAVAASGSNPAVPAYWKDVWVQIDHIKDYNWNSEDEVLFRVTSNCAYKEILVIITNNHYVEVPVGIQETLNQTVNIRDIHVNISDPISLKPNLDFSLSSDKSTVTLADSAYSNNKDYRITYYHGIDITDLLPENITESSIKIPGIPKTSNPSQFVAKYDYQNQALLSDIRYYSPICKEYRVTLV